MPGHDIIVIGASAGGVEALAELVRGLPSDLPAAVFTAVHFSPHATSVLPKILSRAGSLTAAHPQDKETIRPGHIYVAPPDFHLLVASGFVRVVRGPKENNVRPAVDPLFRTAARVYGPRVVGVVLTGMLGDGAAGLWAVKARGGVAVVQDPNDAVFPDMPRNAIEYVEVDHVLPLSDIASLLTRLAHEPVAEDAVAPASDEMQHESDIAEVDMAAIENNDKPGTPSGFGCPECGGVLWELHDGALLRFRCRVGHAYSADSLLEVQSNGLEEALWSALRALEENASLARRLEEKARQRNHDLTAANFERRAQATEHHAATIRQLLLKSETATPVNGPHVS